MTEKTKQKVPRKNIRADKTQVITGNDRETPQPGVETAVSLPTTALHHLPDHPTTRPLRQASLLQMQHTLGNRATQRFIQRAANSPTLATERDLGERIEAKIGSGHNLEAGIQRQLEAGLEADLSKMRVHTDGEADQLARSVDAVAFTTGQDVFFREGTYAPHSPDGLRLLAHEAAHTVQQTSGPVAGTPAPGGVSISDPADSFEQSARQTADNMMLGEATPDRANSIAQPAPMFGVNVQRMEVCDENGYCWEEEDNACSPEQDTSGELMDHSTDKSTVHEGDEHGGGLLSLIPPILAGAEIGMETEALEAGSKLIQKGQPMLAAAETSNAMYAAGALGILGGGIEAYEGIEGALHADSWDETIIPGLQIGAGTAGVIGGAATTASTFMGMGGMATPAVLATLAELGPVGALITSGVAGYKGGEWIGENLIDPYLNRFHTEEADEEAIDELMEENGMKQTEMPLYEDPLYAAEVVESAEPTYSEPSPDTPPEAEPLDYDGSSW